MHSLVGSTQILLHVVRRPSSVVTIIKVFEEPGG